MNSVKKILEAALIEIDVQADQYQKEKARNIMRNEMK